MKIFISHSSDNKIYGEALVKLLREIGIQETEIIFTSDAAYGIPIGQNIFDWLKSQLNEKPYVIYLLSKEYYSSIACLNEMGAAWIIENIHTIIFTPDFDLSCKEFYNGVIDPREIGFFINNKERLYGFIDQLKNYFSISSNSTIVNRSVTEYLIIINSIPSPTKIKEPILRIKEEAKSICIEQSNNQTLIQKKLITDIITDKLTEEELLLLHYVRERGCKKLRIGWQLTNEIDEIKMWEEIQNLNDKLSRRYQKAIGKLEIRGYTEVSAVTNSGKSKELEFKEDIKFIILDLPSEVTAIIDQTVKNNYKSIFPDYDF